MPPPSPADPHPSVLRSSLEAELAPLLGSDLEARWVAAEVTDPGEARALARRRRAGEPLQYLLGHWSFRTLDLLVDERVLIPRPETEAVVEVALGELEGWGRAGGRADPVVVDLGTGSGAIALAIATEARRRFPEIRVLATDVSEPALRVARANLVRAEAQVPGTRDRVTLVHGDWWGALPGDLHGSIDLAVANPPYVSSAEWPGLQREVRDHEPRRALVAGDGPGGVPGLADVALVLGGAVQWLAPGGSVVVELAPHQAAAARRVAREVGLSGIRVERDLAGRQRAVVGRRRAPAADSAPGTPP